MTDKPIDPLNDVAGLLIALESLLRTPGAPLLFPKTVLGIANDITKARVNLQAHIAREETIDELRIVCALDPVDESVGAFLEVENKEGKSISVGKWRKREDGRWELVIKGTRKLEPVKIVADQEGLPKLSKAEKDALATMGDSGGES